MNTNIIFQSKRFRVVVVAVMAVAVALYFGYLEYQKYQKNITVPIEMEILQSDEFGFSFKYPVGEKALTLIEPPIENQAFLKAYLLIPSDEYVAFTKATDAQAAPASISVFIYELGDEPAETGSTTMERPNRITRLQNWAMDNTAITSFASAKATPDIIEIDGVKALHYKAEGQYQQDVYLATYHGFIYMFVSQYKSDTDFTYTAFQDLITSVSFE